MLSVKYKATYGENITLYGTCGNQSEAWEIKGPGSDFVKIQLKVSVNGSDTNPCFRIYSNIDNIHNKWAIITEKGNNIDILLIQNKSTEDRTCTLIVYNLFNSDEYVAFDFIQNKETYGCEVKSGSTLRTNINGETIGNVCSYADNVLTLKENIINKESKPWGYSDIIFELNVSGGSREAVIASVKQYTGNDVIQDDKTYRTSTPFDKGIVCKLLQTKQQIKDYCNSEKIAILSQSNYLVVRHYGRVFVDESNYYIITLAHKDYRQCQTNIIVKYKNNDRALALMSNEIELKDYNVEDGKFKDLNGVEYEIQSTNNKVAQIGNDTVSYSIDDNGFFEIDGLLYQIHTNDDNVFVTYGMLEFNSNGRSKKEHNSVVKIGLSFGNNCIDYGYKLTANTDNTLWCNIQEQIDCITVACCPNYETARHIPIIISSTDSDNDGYIQRQGVLITQDGVDDYLEISSIVTNGSTYKITDDRTITVSGDTTQILFNMDLYGENRNNIEKYSIQLYNGSTLIENGCTIQINGSVKTPYHRISLIVSIPENIDSSNEPKTYNVQFENGGNVDRRYTLTISQSKKPTFAPALRIDRYSIRSEIAVRQMLYCDFYGENIEWWDNDNLFTSQLNDNSIFDIGEVSYQILEYASQSDNTESVPIHNNSFSIEVNGEILDFNIEPTCVTTTYQEHINTFVIDSDNNFIIPPNTLGNNTDIHIQIHRNLVNDDKIIDTVLIKEINGDYYKIFRTSNIVTYPITNKLSHELKIDNNRRVFTVIEEDGVRFATCNLISDKIQIDDTGIVIYLPDDYNDPISINSSAIWCKGVLYRQEKDVTLSFAKSDANVFSSKRSCNYYVYTTITDIEKLTLTITQYPSKYDERYEKRHSKMKIEVKTT